MTTLATLRAQIRATTPDATQWPDATLNLWIADAIRFYSAEFPRIMRHTQAMTTGTQAYVLPAGHRLQSVLSVEYPIGQNPPRFLREVMPSDPTMTQGEQAYCLLPIDDSTTQANDDDAGTITFIDTVTTGTSAEIIYSADHATPTGDTSQITVPSRHWEALIAFVEFRAHWQLETGEATDVSAVTLTLAQLGEEARRAWNRYKEVIDRLRFDDAGKSRVVSWHTASGGRIY